MLDRSALEGITQMPRDSAEPRRSIATHHGIGNQGRGQNLLRGNAYLGRNYPANVQIDAMSCGMLGRLCQTWTSR